MGHSVEGNAYRNGLAAGLLEGDVSVPTLLLRTYRKLNLTDQEAMLLIHLMAFRQKELKEFPTIEELQSRMSAPAETVIKMLQRLMKDEFLGIEDETDPETGIRYERYDWSPLLYKMAGLLAEEWQDERGRPSGGELHVQAKSADVHAVNGERDLFTIFEKEFGRPLSPMECETISHWLDEDRYPVELILAALKEAVFAGKIYFRYVDRILLEWSRNRVYTVEQAKQHAQKFRSYR